MEAIYRTEFNDMFGPMVNMSKVYQWVKLRTMMMRRVIREKGDLQGFLGTLPKCLACALSNRSFGYTAANRSSDCQACFKTWWWDGTDNTTDPANYAPDIGSTPSWLVQKDLVGGGTGNTVGSSMTSISGQLEGRVV